MKKVFFKNHDVKTANEKLINSRCCENARPEVSPKESVFGILREDLRFDSITIIENINRAWQKAFQD